MYSKTEYTLCTHGSSATIHALHANVILHVPEGVFGIILGNVHTNFRTFSHLVQEADCIISPMCEFELHNYDDIPRSAWYTIQVPHIVKNTTIEGKIMVKRERQVHENFYTCIAIAERGRTSN